jgi:XRE family aerobic/anaerobic benzoate catabolism transcriptional regulator
VARSSDLKGDLSSEPRRGTLPADEAYLKQVGELVRVTRAGRGMTRRILAQASGVSERYLADLERGIGNASLLVLKQVADAMGVSVTELVGPRSNHSPELDQLIARLETLGSDQLGEVQRFLTAHVVAPSPRPTGRIALIGMRGAGKTSIGQVAAERLAMPFIELDSEIERLAGMELAEIFAVQGQAVFRKLEHRALETVIDGHETAVIATTGSLVTEPAAYALLRSRCFVVWLSAAPEQHMARVMAQGDLRPMADNPQAMDDLKAILESRAPLHALADAAIDTTDLDLDTATQKLLEFVERARAAKG